MSLFTKTIQIEDFSWLATHQEEMVATVLFIKSMKTTIMVKPQDLNTKDIIIVHCMRMNLKTHTIQINTKISC